MQSPTDVLFDYASISLWEQDFSGVKRSLDALRAQGVTDLRAYLAAHLEAVAEAMGRIEVLKVNRRTLELFGAASQERRCWPIWAASSVMRCGRTLPGANCLESIQSG